MRTLLALLLLTPALLAAPVPEDKEKPKPRAKLLGSITLEQPVSSVFWLSDGRYVVVCGPEKVAVYPRDQFVEDAPKPVFTLDRPDKGRGQVGPTPDGGLFVFAPAGDQLNAENRLHCWSAKTLLAGGVAKPDRTVDLEVDNPGELVYSADGRSLYTAAYVRMSGGKLKSRLRFVRLSAKTGDVKSTVPFGDLSGDGYMGHTFDPQTGRLYLVTVTANREQAAVQCREPDGGKQLWSALLPGQPNPPNWSTSAAVAVAGNGERVVVTHTARVIRPNPVLQPGVRPEFDSGWAVTLIDASKGEVVADASSEPTAGTEGRTPPAISANGRLVFAVANGRVSVSDVKTGEELKGWERYGVQAIAAFQPGGHELLLAERGGKGVYGPTPSAGSTRDSGQPPKTVVGLWDFSPVVK